MKKRYRDITVILIVLAICATFGSSATKSVRTNRSTLITSMSASISDSPGVRRYQIDAGQSHFIVHAFVGGLLSGFGHNHNIAIQGISGEAQFTDVTVAPASLHMKIRADSLSVTDKVSAKDRQSIEQTMREEVLETAKYPEITFNSTRIETSKTPDGQYQTKIWGNLTLHGVTHPGLITAQLTFDSKSLRARGEFPLKMTEYNIKPPSVAGGTIKVKDTLKFTFDIVAH
jgi:polyisoprenoid-binding protein YceI